MMNLEIPKTLLSKEAAEKEADAMREVIEGRRRITGLVKPSNQDYQEAFEKVERDKHPMEKEKREGEKSKEIQELFDAVLFDWDGVLYDSMETLAKSAVIVCREFGVEIDAQKFLETYDQPYQEWYKKLGIPADNEAAHKYIRCVYNDEIKPMIKAQKDDMMFPDAVATLRDLKERGLKLGIVSADRGEAIRKVLEENSITDLFDYFFDRANDKSVAIGKVCQENGLDPVRVLMVGDLPSDLRDARKAGVKVAGIARSVADKDRLGSYDPDYLLGGLGEEITKPISYVDKKFD